jgi:hypothetical protein
MTFAISASFLILQKIVWTKSSSAMDYMLLIFKDLKSCLSFSVSVIAQLDWAIQKKNWIIRSSRIMTIIGTGFRVRYE